MSQPLLALPANPANQVTKPLLQVDGAGVVVTSIRPSRDGAALMIRLFAVSGSPEHCTLQWATPSVMYRSSPDENRGEKVQGPIDLPGYGIVTLRIESI